MVDINEGIAFPTINKKQPGSTMIVLPPQMAFPAALPSGGPTPPPAPSLASAGRFDAPAIDSGDAPTPTFDGGYQHVRLPFDEIFQSKALGILLRQPNMLAEYADILKPSYFENEAHRSVITSMLALFRKYNMAPTVEMMRNEIGIMGDRMRFSDTYKQEMLDVVTEAMQIDLSEAKYIHEKMIDFCKLQAAREVAFGLVRQMQEFEQKGKGSFDEVAPAIRKLASIGAPGSRGTSFHADYHSLPERLRNNHLHSSGFKIPTGFKRVDRVIGGGCAAGTINFVAGGAGAGKSTWLNQIAANALKAKCNVMIFTHELKEPDYELKLAQHFTGVGENHVKGESQRYLSRVQRMTDVLKDVFCVIKYYPPGVATVDMLRSYMSRVTCEMNNGKPWLIVVDYLEQLRLGDPTKVQTWESIGRVTDELIAFGWDYSAPVWTASQITRAGYSKVKNSDGRRSSGKEDIGASWKKVEKADLLLMFDQSGTEKAGLRARIRVEKNRRGRDGFSFLVRDERPLMSFIEIDDAETNSFVYGYSPTNADLDPDTNVPKDWLTIRPDNWDQITPMFGESLDGYFKTPEQELIEYQRDLVQTIAEEQTGYEFDDARRELEAKTGVPIGAAGPDGQVTYAAPNSTTALYAALTQPFTPPKVVME